MYTNIGPFHTFKSPTKKVDTTLINVIYLLFKKEQKNTFVYVNTQTHSSVHSEQMKRVLLFIINVIWSN